MRLDDDVIIIIPGIDEDSRYIFNIWDCNMFAKKEKYHHLKGDRELILHTKQQTSAFIIIYREIYNKHTHTRIYI